MATVADDPKLCNCISCQLRRVIEAQKEIMRKQASRIKELESILEGRIPCQPNKSHSP